MTPRAKDTILRLAHTPTIGRSPALGAVSRVQDRIPLVIWLKI